MKKQLVIKIIVTFVLIVAVFVIFLYQKSKKQPISHSDGSVTIVIINKEEVEVSNRKINFQKGDHLYELLVKHYRLVVEDGAHGKVLYGIDDILTDFVHSYLAIYINDKYSEVGLSYIELKDGLVVKFVEMRL